MDNYEEFNYFYNDEEFQDHESQEEIGSNRDYNFRKFHKKREQERRALIYKGYFPTMPKMNIGENGEPYYTEGSKDLYKQFLKRAASKKVRKAKVVSNFSYYKKVFDLPWIWY